MKNFLSSKSKIITIFLWIMVLGLSALIVNAYLNKEAKILPIILLSIVTAILLWILLDTRYVLKNNFLLYRSGPFRGRIDIGKIKKIKAYSGLNIPVITKPALDTKGFIITSNNLDDIFISPKNSSDFLTEIKKINPKIEVN